MWKQSPFANFHGINVGFYLYYYLCIKTSHKQARGTARGTAVEAPINPELHSLPD